MKKLSMKNRVKQFALPAILLSALALTGCQTSPNANVQPTGKPGLIQAGIPVEIIQGPVTVESLDASKRLITLRNATDSTKTFYLDAAVQNLDQVKIGDIVNATVKAEMSVYILQNGRIPNPDGTTRPKTINFNAKVLTVNPVHRQLTLIFTNGRSMTIKAGSDVQLEKMASGDHVIIRSHEVIAIAILKS
jgi:hypothetical protein